MNASTTTDFLAQAAQCIGAANVIAGQAIEPRYLKPARYHAGQAFALVKPQTTQQASELVQLAQAAQLQLIVQGAHTGLVCSATPTDADRHIILSTERLRERFELDPLDEVLHVSAGFRLSEVNERLREQGLHFAVDLSADPYIGGMLATNTGGTRMLRYGDVRANTLGLTVVLSHPSGQILDLEGGWMKNNAGLDFKHLFIGSNGAFGIITQSQLKLQRLPNQRVATLIAPCSREAVWSIYQAAKAQLGEFISAFEGISQRALELTLAHRQDETQPFGTYIPEYTLLLELSCNLPTEQLNLAQVLESFLEQQFETGSITDAVLGREEAFWEIRHSIGEGLRAHGHVMGMDLSFPRLQFWGFIDSAKRWLGQHLPIVEVADFGHLGDGGVHFNLVWPHTAPLDPKAFELARLAMYELAVNTHAGCFSAEHGIGPHVQAIYDQYTPSAHLELAQRLSSVLAPRGGFSLARY